VHFCEAHTEKVEAAPVMKGLLWRSQSVEEAKMRLKLFTPAYEQLVMLMKGRVRYPEDWESWEEDDRDDFKHARQSVAETLVDAAGERPCLPPGPARVTAALPIPPHSHLLSVALLVSMLECCRSTMHEHRFWVCTSDL
jgi:hypothetical protein